MWGRGGAEINSKCAYRGGGVKNIQNALIGGFSFNQNALIGGSYQIRGIQNVWGGGQGTYKTHFISEINYWYLPIPGVHECKASYVMGDNRLILMYGA